MYSKSWEETQGFLYFFVGWILVSKKSGKVKEGEEETEK